MAGSATLDPDVLVDGLVTDVIDGLREALHPAFGVRAYRVFTVVRTWSRGEVGVGEFTDVEVELTPQPLVTGALLSAERGFSSVGFDAQPCGLDEAGIITIREISLTYTFAELLAGEAPPGTEHLIKVVEAHGQEQPPTYWVYHTRPYPDRVKNMGWIAKFTRATSAD